MLHRNRKSLLVTSLLAALIASAGTAAVASAAEYEGGGGDDDDSSFKSAACSLIGCANGSRICGTAAGTIKAGVPPFVGEVSVSYTCYENALY